MLKKIFLVIATLFLFTACSENPNEKPLRISSTTWIGYIPLYYAREKGWLDTLNIKVSTVVSLSENMSLYKSGNFDAYVGTQYEYSVLAKKDDTLMPVIMFDRSYGGDIVMANMSVEELQSTNSNIDVYLEMDSINFTIFKDFIRVHNLTDKNINFINKDQSYIATLRKKDMRSPTIIVTYNPYNINLEKTGFIEVASTKDGLDLFVVDALFTKSNVLLDNEQRFSELKKLVDQAIEVIKKDPKGFYEVVKGYLEETSYEDFKQSLNDIIWINKNLSPELKTRIQESKLPIRGIIN